MIILAAIFLAGQAVHFDGSGVHFTNRQIRATAPSTRAGLEQWAATPHGRQIVETLDTSEYEIDVAEGDCDGAAGIAPAPALGTMVMFAKHDFVKHYTITIDPAAAPDLMAAAWAAEMLHVWFYAHGITLPHHRRDDFQTAWHAVAAELGMPNLRHDDDEEERPHVIGRRRVR